MSHRVTLSSHCGRNFLPNFFFVARRKNGTTIFGKVPLSKLFDQFHQNHRLWWTTKLLQVLAMCFSTAHGKVNKFLFGMCYQNQIKIDEFHWGGKSRKRSPNALVHAFSHRLLPPTIIIGHHPWDVRSVEPQEATAHHQKTKVEIHLFTLSRKRTRRTVNILTVFDFLLQNAQCKSSDWNWGVAVAVCWTKWNEHHPMIVSYCAIIQWLSINSVKRINQISFLFLHSELFQTCQLCMSSSS